MPEKPVAACCGGDTACCSGGVCTVKEEPSSAKIRDAVKDYYGKVLCTSKDLKTNACTASGRPPRHILDRLVQIPEEVLVKFLGCGSPLPADIQGKTVVDMGSGSGRDSYVAASLVGPSGKVIGIDMTDEQLAIATKYAETYCTKTLGYPSNVLEFKKGYIEHLEDVGIAPESVDVVISNCVINLSPDKEAVIKGVARILKEGGELYFADMYCDRRVPECLKKDSTLWGEGIAGALYVEDFKRIARKAGFTDPRVLSKSVITVKDPALREIIGEAQYYSILFRCFKLKSLETLCEDYGQVATYQGGIPGSTHAYDLDDHHHFIKGKPVLVCGNTASMLQETRLSKYFVVQGDRSVHFGLFPCGPTGGAKTADSAAAAAAAGGGGCSSGGGCC